MPGPTFDQLKEGMERIGGQMHQSRQDAQGLASSFHQFAADALPLGAQFKALSLIFKGTTGMFKDIHTSMSTSAVDLQRQWREQRINIVEARREGNITAAMAHELQAQMRRLRGLQDAKVAAARLFENSSKLAVKWLEIAVLQGGVLATELYSMNNALIKANSALEHRNKLMVAGLETSVRTGAMFIDVLDAQRALVELGLNMADNYKDVLETTVLLNKGIGLSTQAAAQLAVVVQYQVGGSFERVAKTLVNIVNQTSLAADETARMATELGRIMSMIRGTQGAAILPDVLKAVAKYEDALKRIGGQAGLITELVDKLTGPSGFGMAGMLGVASPEIMATEQGVQTMMRNLAALGDQMVGQSQGWQRRMGLEALANILGVNAKQANELYLSAKRASSGIDEELTLRERYAQQTKNLVAGLQILASRVVALIEAGLLPFIRVLGQLVGLVNSVVDWLGQFKGFITVVSTLAMVAVPIAIFSLGRLIATLYKVAVAATAAKLGLDTKTAGLGAIITKLTGGAAAPPVLPGSGIMAWLNRLLPRAFGVLVGPIGWVITALVTAGGLLWKIYSVLEATRQDNRKFSAAHGSRLKELSDREQSRLYTNLRAGDFSNMQRQVNAALTAYAAYIDEEGYRKGSTKFDELMATKAAQLGRLGALAGVASSQFKETMTPADNRLLQAQLSTGMIAKQGLGELTRAYHEQAKVEKEAKDKEQQEAQMHFYQKWHLFTNPAFLFHPSEVFDLFK